MTPLELYGPVKAKAELEMMPTEFNGPVEAPNKVDVQLTANEDEDTREQW